MFASKGYHGCRIADIARDAGVAYGLVYHYFQNKEQLLQSVFKQSWEPLVARVQAVVHSSAPVDAKVRALVAEVFAAYRADPAAVKVLVVEIGRSTAVGRSERGGAFFHVLELARQMFLDAQHKGELPRPVNAALCAALLFGALEMSLTAFIVGMVEPTPELLAAAETQVAQMLLGGMLHSNSSRNTLSGSTQTPSILTPKWR